MALGSLLNIKQAGQRFSERTREDVQRRAGAEGQSILIQRLEAEKRRKNRSNPFNAIIGAITGFVASGGNPLGAIAGGFSGAQVKGETDVLKSVGAGTGGGLTTSKLGELVKGAPGTVDLGGLVRTPSRAGQTASLLTGLAEGKPLEGVAAAQKIEGAEIDAELKRRVTKTQLAKLEKEVDSGNFQFDAKSNTIFNKDTGEVTIGPEQLGEPSLEPEVQFTQERKLRTEYNDLTKTFRIVRDQASIVETIATAEPSPAGDLSLIFAYMKILDPRSTVREGEQATAAQARSIPEAIWSLRNRMLKGEKLGTKQRADFLNRARQLAKSSETQFKKTTNEYRRLADAYNLDGSRVIVDFTTTSSQQPVLDSFISEYASVFGKQPSQEIIEAFKKKQGLR